MDLTHTNGRAIPKIIVVLLTVATATIHFSRAVADPDIRVLFFLNGLGYLVLVGLLYLPLPKLHSQRGLVCRVLMGYTAATIVLYLVWIVMSGEWAIPLGPVDKVIEVALFGLLWQEDRVWSKAKKGGT